LLGQKGENSQNCIGEKKKRGERGDPPGWPKGARRERGGGGGRKEGPHFLRGEGGVKTLPRKRVPVLNKDRSTWVFFFGKGGGERRVNAPAREKKKRRKTNNWFGIAESETQVNICGSKKEKSKKKRLRFRLKEKESRPINGGKKTLRKRPIPLKRKGLLAKRKKEKRLHLSHVGWGFFT